MVLAREGPTSSTNVTLPGPTSLLIQYFVWADARLTSRTESKQKTIER